jgi:hypothetical protein
VPENEKVVHALRRFELVDWQYDGLGGKVIRWTQENGSDHDDPSVLAFVAQSDGTVLEKAKDAYTPSSFAKWLNRMADKVERANPKTRVPLVRADVVAEGEGAARKVRCAALDAAREAGKPVLVYVGRSSGADDGKAEKTQVATSRRFEKGTLSAKSAAAACEGWVLLHLDLRDPDHRIVAKTLGVEKAPALLMLLPGAEKPESLGTKLSGQSLAYKLKKHAPD